MFCPSCGKADQNENTYCRQCGEFLPDFEGGGKRRPRKTPADLFRLSLTFNLLSAVAGISMAIALIVTHAGNEGTHPVIYAATSLLTVISIWQIVSFFNNLKLRKRFVRRDEEVEESGISELKARKTKELLPEADLRQVIPASVTESTTRTLDDKIKISSQPKQESD